MLTFEKSSHIYRLDGFVIPHVTRVTDALSSYAGVPEDVLRRKAEIGDAVHYATELEDANDLDYGSLPLEIRGYLDAWRRFKEETGFVPSVSEHRVHSKLYRYAGTLDRIGYFSRMKNIKPSVPALIDLKTTYAILPAVGPQTAGYMQAWNETCGRQNKVKRRYAVQLKTDGTYYPHECTDPSDWSVFLSALTLLNWKLRNNLEKVA